MCNVQKWKRRKANQKEIGVSDKAFSMSPALYGIPFLFGLPWCLHSFRTENEKSHLASCVLSCFWWPVAFLAFTCTDKNLLPPAGKPLSSVQFSSIQSLSCVQLFATPSPAALQASLSITNCRSLPKPMSIELMMPSNHLILCCPLLLPSIFPRIRVFSNESALHMRWPKYWRFNFSIYPSSEYLVLIAFRKDRLDLLAMQRSLKSLLQYHSSKASILKYPAFFIVQHSNPYMTTGKTIALTRQTFIWSLSLPFTWSVFLEWLVILFLSCLPNLRHNNIYFIKLLWRINCVCV